MNSGRCEGAITGGSAELRNDPFLIGCHDLKRIMKFYRDLHESDPLHSYSPQHERILLPAFIPVLQSGMPKETALDSNRIYGVSLRTVLDFRASFKHKTGRRLREALRLPQNGRLALFLTGKDNLIERAWKFSKTKDLWKRISDFKFEFVTSATFSVYEDDPRSDQIYNQERNFRTYDIFCELGVPTIPFLFFNPSSSLDFCSVIKWLRYRPEVGKIAILAQCYRHPMAFHRLLQQIRAIVIEIARPLAPIFVGVASIDKVRQVVIEYPDACFVTAHPVMHGLNGCETHLSIGEEGGKETPRSRAEQIIANIGDYDSYIELIKNKYHSPNKAHQYALPF